MDDLASLAFFSHSTIPLTASGTRVDALKELGIIQFTYYFVSNLMNFDLSVFIRCENVESWIFIPM